MKSSVVMVPHVACPSCDNLSAVDHVQDGQEMTWWCDNDLCGHQYRFTINNGEIDSQSTGVIVSKTSVLLKRGDLSIIVKGVKITDPYDDHYSGYDEDGCNRFFYEESTCPSNYLRETEEVFYNGQSDVHGLFEYVGTLPYGENLTPEDFEE